MCAGVGMGRLQRRNRSPFNLKPRARRKVGGRSRPSRFARASHGSFPADGQGLVRQARMPAAGPPLPWATILSFAKQSQIAD